MKINSVLKPKHMVWASGAVLAGLLLIVLTRSGAKGLGTGPTTHRRGRNRRAEKRSRLWRMDRDSHRAGECRRKSAGHRLSAHSEI